MLLKVSIEKGCLALVEGRLFQPFVRLNEKQFCPSVKLFFKSSICISKTADCINGFLVKISLRY